MAVRLKKLTGQVIVMTGASSGIGLVAARMAAKEAPDWCSPPAAQACCSN